MNLVCASHTICLTQEFTLLIKYYQDAESFSLSLRLASRECSFIITRNFLKELVKCMSKKRFSQNFLHGN